MPDARDLKELDELMKDYDTALLTTRGADGHYHTRPMALQKRSITDGLWFATWRDTEKIHDLESHPDCGVALYSGKRSATYVSLSGTGQIVEDRDTIHRMWDLSWKPWFPDGPDTADLVLIRVQPEHVEFVHPQTGRLQVLFTMAKRLLTHERTEPAPKKQLDLPEPLH